MMQSEVDLENLGGTVFRLALQLPPKTKRSSLLQNRLTLKSKTKLFAPSHMPNQQQTQVSHLWSSSHLAKWGLQDPLGREAVSMPGTEGAHNSTARRLDESKRTWEGETPVWIRTVGSTGLSATSAPSGMCYFNHLSPGPKVKLRLRLPWFLTKRQDWASPLSFSNFCLRISGLGEVSLDILNPQ